MASQKQICHRRTFLTAALGGATAASAFAQGRGQQPPVSSTPSPRDYSRQDPIQCPDPVIVALDDRFRRYIVGNTVIRRLHFGTLWAEGPAWNGVGRYLVWSDIPNNVQMRWIEDDGRVTVFRNPSGYSNGNTFDYEGRELSCEHGGRRVVRYEPNGTVTVIADKFEGKRLNSPNDIAVHPDAGVWFTDPIYGIRCDVDGNIWAGARPGVQVVAPNGERIGMIRLPETCANVCFGGTRRNRLFMTASESLYSVYVETTGAHIA